MAAWTLADAQAHVDAWLAASLAVAGGQSYEIDTVGGRRKLTRVDAAEIRQMVNFWRNEVNVLASSGTRRRTYYVVPE